MARSTIAAENRISPLLIQTVRDDMATLPFAALKAQDGAARQEAYTGA